jgi:hypothetical protein
MASELLQRLKPAPATAAGRGQAATLLESGGPAQQYGGEDMDAASVLALQHQAGNRAVARMLATQRVLQRTLTATGDAAGFAAFANRVIGVQFEVVIGPGGVVSLRGTDIQGPPTPEAQELVRVLQMVIGDRRNTSIEFIHGRTSTRASDARVVGGSFPQSKVDLDDEEARGTQGDVGLGMGVTGGALLVHEILEQYRKQVFGEDFPTAHAQALTAEGTAIGAPRGASTTRTVDATTDEVTTRYTYPDGRVVEVIWDVTANNIFNVRRRVVSPGRSSP